MTNVGMLKYTKYKGSKKSKSSWRKHTDIADVEDHLEEERKDERTGVMLMSGANLFFVDSKHEGGGKKENHNADEDDDDDDDEQIYVSRRDKLQQKLLKEKMAEEEKRKKLQTTPVVTIWGQDVMTIVDDAYIESAMKKQTVKPSTVDKGKSELNALAIPPAGSSYNPDYSSHQSLLSQAHRNELNRLHEREKLNRKVKMVSAERLKKQSKNYLREMTEGLIHNEDRHNEDERDCDEENVSQRVPNKERKTSKSKKREKLKKNQADEKLRTKRANVLVNDIFRIKTLKKEIIEGEKKLVSRKKRKLEEQARVSNIRTKRLSKHKFVEPPIAVHLSEELTSSLREMKAEGNLIQDRFKSLQERNIIEPRKPVIPHRKHKKKLYNKKSYNIPTIKEFKLKT